MKKLFSILLTLVMLLSLAPAAFAAEEPKTTIRFESTERSYNGYQLLGLTTSLKTGDHHPDSCNGTDHSDNCYNYAYTVNGTYRSILQKETFDNGGNYLWDGGTKPGSAELITDAQILEYLSNQISDNGDVYHTMRQVADRVYRAIMAADPTLSPDATGLKNSATLDQGYWMFVDVTDTSAPGSTIDTNSLVVVDTAGQTELTVKPKVALPTIEKKVKDIEDSEDNNISDNAWQDSADHDIGDNVPFKLTATLPSNAQFFTAYKMVFHDTLSPGLTLKNGSFKVLMYETKHKADVDTDLNDFAEDVTGKFTPTTDGLTDDCSFHLTCENVFTIEGVTKDTAFVVYYEATLNKENAVIGADGNPNEAYLEFSNNPYVPENTGETEADKVQVFTYKLTVNKTDSHGHKLTGAGFTLYKKALDGTYDSIGSELTGADMTTFSWTGLDDGDYKLEESTVPAGYNKLPDVMFSISADHEATSTDPKLISLDGGLMGQGTVDSGKITGEIEKDIVNNTGTILPETGAAGTFMLIGGGTLLVILAAVFMITRKKMSIYED